MAAHPEGIVDLCCLLHIEQFMSLSQFPPKEPAAEKKLGMRLEESVRLARNKSLLSGWLLLQFLIRFYVVCLNTTAFLVQFLFGSKETLHRTSSARDNASDASTSAVQGLDRVRRRHFCPKTPHQD